jgi:hypothetical protein
MHTSFVRSLVVIASCLSLIAGCAGESSEQRYDTKGVIRAFRSVGIELRNERIFLDGCKDFPPGVTAMNSGCVSVVIGLDGKPLSKKERAESPQVALYPRQRLGRRVWGHLDLPESGGCGGSSKSLGREDVPRATRGMGA